MRVLVSMCTLLSLVACSKTHEPSTAITTTKKDCVGDWEGGTTKLHVGDDGHVVYDRGTIHVDRTIDHFEGSDIWFVSGVMFGTDPNARLRIQSPPAASGSDWKMTIEGIEVTRIVFGGAKVETAIRADAAKLGISLRAVTCATSTSGGTFDCTIQNTDGDTFLAHCTYDLAWTTSWNIDAAVIHSRIVEGQILAFIKANGRLPVFVTCPTDDLMKPAGSTFKCDAGGSPVVVTVDDTKGHVHFTVPPVVTAPSASASTSSKKSQTFDPFSIGRRP